jgi:hypothetical protein
VPLSPESVYFSPSSPSRNRSKAVIDLVTTPEAKRQASPVRQAEPSVPRAQIQADTIDLVDESPALPSDDPPLGSSQGGEEDEEAEFQRMAAAARQRAQQGDNRNPVIQVFVEPLMPDVMPVAVKIHYQQTFKEVRQSWCQTNIAAGKLPPSTEPDVIIKLNGRKIYDVQTCKSLGIGLDTEGRPTLQDAHGIPQPLEMVHIYATTRQLEDEEREKRLREADAPDAPSSPAEAKEPEYKLVLRSRDYDEMKVTVKQVCRLWRWWR